MAGPIPAQSVADFCLLAYSLTGNVSGVEAALDARANPEAQYTDDTFEALAHIPQAQRANDEMNFFLEKITKKQRSFFKHNRYTSALHLACMANQEGIIRVFKDRNLLSPRLLHSESRGMKQHTPLACLVLSGQFYARRVGQESTYQVALQIILEAGTEVYLSASLFSCSLVWNRSGRANALMHEMCLRNDYVGIFTVLTGLSADYLERIKSIVCRYFLIPAEHISVTKKLSLPSDLVAEYYGVGETPDVRGLVNEEILNERMLFPGGTAIDSYGARPLISLAIASQYVATRALNRQIRDLLISAGADANISGYGTMVFYSERDRYDFVFGPWRSNPSQCRLSDIELAMQNPGDCSRSPISIEWS